MTIACGLCGMGRAEQSDRRQYERGSGFSLLFYETEI